VREKLCTSEESLVSKVIHNYGEVLGYTAEDLESASKAISQLTKNNLAQLELGLDLVEMVVQRRQEQK